MALLWAALPNDGVAFVADWFFQKVAFHKGVFGEFLGRWLLMSSSCPFPELRKLKLTRFVLLQARAKEAEP